MLYAPVRAQHKAYGEPYLRTVTVHTKLNAQRLVLLSATKRNILPKMERREKSKGRRGKKVRYTMHGCTHCELDAKGRKTGCCTAFGNTVRIQCLRSHNITTKGGEGHTDKHYKTRRLKYYFILYIYPTLRNFGASNRGTTYINIILIVRQLHGKAVCVYACVVR